MAKSDKQQRKLAREAVLQALYAKHVSSEEAKKVLHDILKRYEFDKMTKKFVLYDLYSARFNSQNKLFWSATSLPSQT